MATESPRESTKHFNLSTMRTIVIKSNDQELIEAFEDLAKILSQSFDIEEEQEKIEEEPESKPDKFVSLSAYEELEKMLDDTIEERDKLKRENYKLTKQNESLRQFVAEFMVKANEL